MKFKSALTVTFLFFLILLNAQRKEYKPVDVPENYEAKIDVIYKSENGWDGRIDLYTNSNSKKATPIVLNIHGGGWNHGVKESQRGFN